jgi:hypothetical protein
MHGNRHSPEQIQIYSGTEHELLEEMAERGWWPTSPVYCIACVGELRLSLAPDKFVSTSHWDDDNLDFWVESLQDIPEGASVSLELDVCLRSVLRYFKGLGGRLYSD